MNQMWELMKLAWKHCSNAVYNGINLWIGMWFFIVVFGIFSVANYAFNFMQYVTNNAIVPDSAIVWMVVSAFMGFVNATCTITFAIILACLFIYAVEFTYLCYLYDERAWFLFIIEPIGNFCDSCVKLFWKGIKHLNTIDRKARANKDKHYKDLLSEIQKIKKDDTL